MSYRESHKGKDKGVQYSQQFVNKNYRNFLWRQEQRLLRRCIEGLGIKGPYLDFACGTGRITSFVEQYVTPSYGVDISSSMLSVARRSVKSSVLLQRDITTEDVDLPPLSFITAFRFFLNAEDELRAAVMAKLASLLDKGGILLFNNHMNKWSIHAILVRLYRTVTFNKRRDFNTLSSREVDALVRSAGLVVVQRYYYGFVPILRENTIIPIPLISALERFLRWARVFNGVSTCAIYVCQRQEDV